MQGGSVLRGRPGATRVAGEGHLSPGLGVEGGAGDDGMGGADYESAQRASLKSSAFLIFSALPRRWRMDSLGCEP